MADKDRSKFLLSEEAVPKVEVPKAAPREKRAFSLPAGMQGGAAARVEPSTTEERVAAGERGAEKVAAKGKSADPTLRFRDRTLGWFRTGDELAEVEESDEYESEERRGRRVIWIIVVAALVLAAALVVWRIS